MDLSKLRRLILTLAGLMAALTMTSCATAPGSPPSAAAARADGDASAARMLIRTATMRIEVEDPVAAAERAAAIADRLGGHVSASTQREDEWAELTLRVPVNRLDEALGRLAELGDVKERRLTSEDVTEQAIDLQARIDNLIATRDRLRQHLDRATSVSDIIAIERELTRVQSELESLQGRLAHLQSNAALSTITLSFKRRTILGPLGLTLWGTQWIIEKMFVIR